MQDSGKIFRPNQNATQKPFLSPTNCTPNYVYLGRRFPGPPQQVEWLVLLFLGRSDAGHSRRATSVRQGKSPRVPCFLRKQNSWWVHVSISLQYLSPCYLIKCGPCSMQFTRYSRCVGVRTDSYLLCCAIGNVGGSKCNFVMKLLHKCPLVAFRIVLRPCHFSAINWWFTLFDRTGKKPLAQ